jgi:hypothetical protein
MEFITKQLYFFFFSKGTGGVAPNWKFIKAKETNSTFFIDTAQNTKRYIFCWGWNGEFDFLI